MITTLNKKSELTIEKRLGLKFSDIISMDAEDLDKVVERKIGKSLKVKPFNDERLIGRGSVYLHLNRFLTFNREKLDKYIDHIKVRK